MDLGACLAQGVDTFKREALPFAVVALIFMVVVSGSGLALGPFGSIVGMLASGLMSGAMASMALKALDGGQLEINDGFEVFSDRPGDYIIVGLATSAGALLCGIGVLLTMTLFLFSPLLVVKGADFKTALRESKDLVMAHLGEVVLFQLVLWSLCTLITVLTCGVGALAAAPFMAIATVRLYEQLTGTAPPSGLSNPPPA